MKEIWQYIAQNIKVFGLVLIFIFLPYSYTGAGICIGLLTIYTIMITFLNRKEVVFPFQRAFWLPASIFIITLIGLSYSSNISAGWAAVERSLPLLLLPMVLAQLGVTRQEYDSLKIGYVITITLTVLAIEGRFIWLKLNSQYDFFEYFFSYDYTYTSLTTDRIAQPVYLGSFIVLSNIFCLSEIKSGSRVRKLGSMFSLTLNSFFLFQLSARMPLLMNVLVIVLFVSCEVLIRRFWLGLGIVTLTIVISTMLFRVSGFTRLRVQSILAELSAEDVRQIDPRSRMLIWPTAWAVYKENWIIGVGTGDAEDALRKGYHQRNLNELEEAGLNAHNQYLTFMIRFGVLGFIIVIVNFVWPLLNYFVGRQGEAILFMIVMSSFFFTENVLGRSQGVIFFSVFHPIFLLMSEDERS